MGGREALGVRRAGLAWRGGALSGRRGPVSGNLVVFVGADVPAGQARDMK